MQIDGDSERLMEDKKKPQGKISCIVKILELNLTPTFSNDVLKQNNQITILNIIWIGDLYTLVRKPEQKLSTTVNCYLSHFIKHSKDSLMVETPKSMPSHLETYDRFAYFCTNDRKKTVNIMSFRSRRGVSKHFSR